MKKLIIVIEHEIDMNDIAGAGEYLDQAIENLRSYGSAQITDIRIEEKAKEKEAK